MKNIYRKSIAFLLVLALAAALFAGCGQKAEPTPAVNPSVEASEAVQPAAEDPAASEQAFLGGTPWKNSNIVGNLDAEAPKLQDDFYQAVNYEYLVSHQTPGLVSDVMTQAEPRYESVMKDMINDESYQSDLMNQIRIMYNQAVDYETLLAQGTEPLKPYIQMIESAGSIEELNAVLVSEDFPFNPVFLSIVSPDGMDGENIVGIQSNLTFVDSVNGGAIDYQKELNSDADLGIYLTASIPKVFNWNMVNDPATADAKNSNVVSLVKFEQQYGKEAFYGYKMLGMEYGEADSLYTACSIDEIQEAAGNLPVKKMLEKEGRAQSSHYLVLCVDWLKTMASLYTDENL
ncbi:MAG: hypothetical protein HUJ75_03520, partial [Parasporobacterium sp.]|nr:hypothetical protein [Parasporobacterium sp.]